MNHLSYGGSVAPRTKKLGTKPSVKAIFKTVKRMEVIIRLENAGFSLPAIAAMLCVSVSRLQTLRRDPEYLKARVKITHGIIVDYDGQLAHIKDQRREILMQHLPPALQVLADEIQRPANTLAERKHKTAVALELLDREGTFAKVSRTEIKPVDSFDFERADAESAEIISALRGVPISSHHTKESIEANKEFSNSHTISAVDQQTALDELENTETVN